MVLTSRPDIEFVVSADCQQAAHVWIECRDKWLNSLQRKSGGLNTRRAYERDWNQFFAAYADQELMPWRVSSLHVEGWIEVLYDAGTSDSTVNRKLAALSSYYNYAMYHYTLRGPGGERSLWEHPNPFKVPQRVATTPYGHSKFPSGDQVARILAEIDIKTPQGMRDLALLSGLFVTTRRVSEWIGLRWSDVHDAEAGGKWFTYRYKGGKIKKQRIPTDLWTAVENYLRSTGRLATMQPADYVFLATKDSAKNFRNASGRPTVSERYDPANQPISSRRINDLLKKYGHQANLRLAELGRPPIPDELLHAHGLRHAGARFRRQRGADVYALKDLLGHSNIAITQIYSDSVLDEPDDAAGDAIAAAIMPRQLKLDLTPFQPSAKQPAQAGFAKVAAASSRQAERPVP